jgi:small-conductance mechanosensitive channel
MLRALVLGYVLMFTFGRISNPFWPSILTPLLASQYYVILVHVVILLIVGPLCAFVGWIVAQSARQCRIPAVLAFVMSFLVLTLITDVNLMIREGARTELLLSMLMGLPTLTIMTLFGGGLLTGSPKRSMPIH